MSDEITLRETLADHRETIGDGWCCTCAATGGVSGEDHAAHLETVVLAWVGARLAGARGDWSTGARAAVAAAMVEHGPDGHADGYEEIADAALGAFCEALGVTTQPDMRPGATETAPGAPNPGSGVSQDPRDEFDRSNEVKTTSPLAALLATACDEARASGVAPALVDAIYAAGDLDSAWAMAAMSPDAIALLNKVWHERERVGREVREAAVTCEACPFAGCRGCEAEATRRANGEAK